jgi:DNA-binding transcriptional regulator YdaS (Cro superfamily)
MEDVKHLIDQWQFRRVLADDVGVSVGTVNQWANRKTIPAKYHVPVLRSAASRGIDIDAQRLAELHHTPDAENCTVSVETRTGSAV